jgi:hypothetical protein
MPTALAFLVDLAVVCDAGNDRAIGYASATAKTARSVFDLCSGAPGPFRRQIRRNGHSCAGSWKDDGLRVLCYRRLERHCGDLDGLRSTVKDESVGS